MINVLETYFSHWRGLEIHESSPGSAASAKLAKECKDYVGTQYFPDVRPGEIRDGCRCENLEEQTFEDASFDLVITQDVFEHVFGPSRAFAEIARTLKPGGAHVFSVLWYYWKDTLVRVVRAEDGHIEYLEEPQYHENPIDPNGSLVVREWVRDLIDFVYQSSGMSTTVIKILDRRLGISGEFREVFISYKEANVVFHE